MRQHCGIFLFCLSLKISNPKLLCTPRILILDAEQGKNAVNPLWIHEAINTAMRQNHGSLERIFLMSDRL
jgi:hypothetical protein